jgi:uncharacterized protein
MNAARAVLVALLLGWPFAASADVAVPPLSGRVVDQTGTLSDSDIASLTQTLKDLEARKGSQIAVLIVPTTAPETIEQYSIRVAETWKIGRKKIDDGALLVIAKNDRKLRIEVGYGLEGALTDVTSRRIIDEIITPRFKSGDFGGGVTAGVARIISVVDGEKLPAPAPEASHGLDSDWVGLFNPFNPFVIIVYFVVGTMLRHALGRLVGSVATGAAIGGLAWYLVGSLLAGVLGGAIVSVLTFFAATILASNADFNRGHAGSSGWSGGSSSGGGWSGGGSSSSSDSGGFSGGGGSFGGGGASGSW